MNVECPECAAMVSIAADVELAEIIDCQECGVSLEVDSIDPIRLVIAPEVEEDWGE